MDTPDETPTIAEALQRITDLAERAKREEAARQVDMLEAQGALEAAETELLAVKAALRRDEQGADAVQALVLLGWPRDTGADPLEQLRALLGANASESIVARVKSVVADNERLKAIHAIAKQDAEAHHRTIARVLATIGIGQGESLHERLAAIMADLQAHEKVIKEAKSQAESAIWSVRKEPKSPFSLADLIAELADGYQTADLRKQYIEETRAALGVDATDGQTLPDAAAQLVKKLAAKRDPCSTCRDERRAAVAERDQLAAKLASANARADGDMRGFITQIHDAQTTITKALGIGPTSATLAELVDALVAKLAASEAKVVAVLQQSEQLQGQCVDLTAERDVARGDSLKLADMRLALNGLHDQLIEAGRKEMEHWATREREIEVFAEQTARLPWTRWTPPSIYPIEVYRAVVDRVIADNDPLKPRVSLAEVQASLAKLATQYEPGKRHGIASEVVAEAIESMQANMVAVGWQDAIGDVILTAIRAGVERALDCWTESDKEQDARSHAHIDQLVKAYGWGEKLKTRRSSAIVGDLVDHIDGMARAQATDAAALASLQEHVRELAEVKSLILASGRTMNNLSAVQVMREVLADAAASNDMIGRAEKAERDLEAAARNTLLREEVGDLKRELEQVRMALLAAAGFEMSTRTTLDMAQQVPSLTEFVERGHAIAKLEALRDKLLAWFGLRTSTLSTLGLIEQVLAIKANARAHSWVGKVGNERCWRCHILRDSVAGTVDCPAMNKPEAAPVDG